MTTPAAPDSLAVLSDPSSSLGRIIKAVDELENSNRFDREASMGVASNVTVELLGVFLRKHALLQGVKLRVRAGNHDDVLGDVDAFVREGVENAVLLPFFDNLLPSFEAQAGHLTPEVLAAKEAEVRARYRLAFEKAKSMKSVFVGTFHRMNASLDPATDAVGEALARFNHALREEAAAFPNVRLIDMDEVTRAVGQANSFDRRFYFRAKAPYSVHFLNELARRLSSASRGFGSHFYKALVLDCDNTLWGGTIGEDLLGGIKLDPYDYPGNIFWRVQNELIALEQSGVLLCLSSKNNPEDVDEVLARHPNAALKERHIVLKKVNWNDKAGNLREIARDLNIGLESLVYLDDSDFECAGIRSLLPMVRTFQVPAAIADYPLVVDEIKELFLAGGVSKESRAKTEQYRRRAQAEELKAGHASNEDFLASLGLKVEISRDDISGIPRISELTMKSNQFNLTTRRYGIGDVRGLMESPESTIYSMVVKDKFGNAGLTGIAVLRWQEGAAVVDSFLMSCRVIGRGVEFAVWKEIFRDAAARGCKVVRAEYIRSTKNAQVADFFDRLGLTAVSAERDHRRYESPLESLPAPKIPWIEVSCGR